MKTMPGRGLSTLVGHGLPELLSDEGHEGVGKLQQGVIRIHQYLHPPSKHDAGVPGGVRIAMDCLGCVTTQAALQAL